MPNNIDLSQEVQRQPRYVPVQLGVEERGHVEFYHAPLSSTVVMKDWECNLRQPERDNRLHSNSALLNPLQQPGWVEPTTLMNQRWSEVSFEVYTKTGVEKLVEHQCSATQEQLKKDTNDRFDEVKTALNSLPAAMTDFLKAEVKRQVDDALPKLKAALLEELSKLPERGI